MLGVTMMAMNMCAKLNLAIHHFGILTTFLKDHLNGKNRYWKYGKDATLSTKKRHESLIGC